MAWGLQYMFEPHVYMQPLKVFFIFFFLFFWSDVYAGFYIPVRHAPTVVYLPHTEDTAQRLGSFYRWHKVKEVKKSRAVLYAVLGFLPPMYFFQRGLVSWYLGYKRNYGFTIFAVVYVTLAILLLFDGAVSAGAAFIMYFIVFGLIHAIINLVKFCSGKLKPVNGRHYPKRKRATL